MNLTNLWEGACNRNSRNLFLQAMTRGSSAFGVPWGRISAQGKPDLWSRWMMHLPALREFSDFLRIMRVWTFSLSRSDSTRARQGKFSFRGLVLIPLHLRRRAATAEARGRSHLASYLPSSRHTTRWLRRTFEPPEMPTIIERSTWVDGLNV